MSSERRRTMLVTVMLGMLVYACFWSVTWMTEQRAAAQYAADSLVECEQLAEQITSLRGRQTVATDEASGSRFLGERIREASEAAGFDEPRDRFPQAARPVGNSAYTEKPWTLPIEGVSLPQLATFLYHLTDGTGLTVRDLRLRTPRDAADGQRWDAEATVTYLIYSPGESRRGASE